VEATSSMGDRLHYNHRQPPNASLFDLEKGPKTSRCHYLGKNLPDCWFTWMEGDWLRGRRKRKVLVKACSLIYRR